MSEKLRTLQLSILDIALEVKEICERNNIDYFLIGGSLLGAVRHKGFIPWDDDMDIGMLRSEYDRFVKIASDELHSPYVLQTYDTDENFGFGYAKIRIEGTELLEDYAVNSKQNNGIFLDVFPFDVMPENVIWQKVHYVLFKCVKWAALGKNDYEFVDSKKRKFAKLMSCVFFAFNKNKCMKLQYKICRMFENKKSSNSINMMGAYNYKEYCNTQDITILDELTFEGYYFKVPCNYEKLLTHMYGDYMKLPPVEKRGDQHKILNINLGTYLIKNKTVNDEYS